MQITLEPAQMDELEACYGMIESGRKFQREQGFQQWPDHYPNMDTVSQDIREHKGYVLKADGGIAGYLCITFDGEPAYDQIEGVWQTEMPYAVIHRMAIGGAYRGQGFAGIAFRLIEEICDANHITGIRIDTDFPNKRMQHVLEKYGFHYRGVVDYQGYGKRLAYDKMIGR
ncbi:MAG: GNAT family N-acetyltransferase [Clostridiales bacterium]|nr:GNAT family N-acetyltransferase [Clostridiales bacterium]